MALNRRPSPHVPLLASTAALAVLAALEFAPPAGAAGTSAGSASANTASANAAAAPASLASASTASTASTVVQREWITVSASSYTTTYATVRVYGMAGTKKVEVLGPWTARVGYNGIAKPGAKREGDGKTPSGTYGFAFFFGIDKNPGVSFPYRPVHAYNQWDDDPKSPLYNEWVDVRHQNPGKAPEPMDDPPFYDYGAVISYNTARTPGLGSAIFLHVGDGGDTAGCVALPVTDLLKILRWMKPWDHPTITITG
jgi:L,D-peptidoglycan transpeptidase YkuD (ErfK/YbiS/YcfS/YnhG family)